MRLVDGLRWVTRRAGRFSRFRCAPSASWRPVSARMTRMNRESAKPNVEGGQYQLPVNVFHSKVDQHNNDEVINEYQFKTT